MAMMNMDLTRMALMKKATIRMMAMIKMDLTRMALMKKAIIEVIRKYY